MCTRLERVVTNVLLEEATMSNVRQGISFFAPSSLTIDKLNEELPFAKYSAKL